MSYFRFPKDPERSKIWAINSQRLDLLKKSPEARFNSNVLCASHFEESQFCLPAKNRLIRTAIPTVFDFPILLQTSPEVLEPDNCIKAENQDSSYRAQIPDHPSSPVSDDSTTSTSLRVCFQLGDKVASDSAQISHDAVSSTCDQPTVSALPQKVCVDQKDNKTPSFAQIQDVTSSLSDESSESILTGHENNITHEDSVSSDPLCVHNHSSPSRNNSSTTLKFHHISHSIPASKLKELRTKIKSQQQKIRRLTKKIKKLKSGPVLPRKIKVKRLTEMMSDFISGPCLDFFISQIRMSGRTNCAKRWNNKEIDFALSLYDVSPRAYKLLRKSKFILPSVTTLRRIQLKTGFPCLAVSSNTQSPP